MGSPATPSSPLGLDVPVSTHQSKDLFGGDTSCSFRMSTPTTQAASTPAASAAGNIVVASSATTGSSPTSTFVVTSTVTTLSSPKRTMSLEDYKKARGNMMLARDELEALFDVDSDADMEDGEEEDEVPSSSTRVDPSVESRRPREDDSDASSSKRSRRGSGRPLADAGPLSSPRSGGDSISSNTVVSRTGPVRDPWMPTPSEIQSRFGSTAPPRQFALYSCNGIIDVDATKELDFDPATDQRRDYYIGLFHELRWYGNKNTSRRSRVPEWQALCQSCGAFVENVNKDPAGYRERVRLAHERYERFSKRPKIDRLHWGAVEAGIPCAVPMGIACENCHVGAVRVSEQDINGCPWRSAPSRTVGDYSSRPTCTPFGGFGGGGLRTPSPFPERPASGCSAAPTYRGSEEIITNEYENDPDLGSGSDDQQFAGRSSEFPPVHLAVGVEAAGTRRGSGPPDLVDRLEAAERLQIAEFPALKQELALLKAQLAQVAQTASNVAGRPWVETECLANARRRAPAGVGSKSPSLGDSCCA
ncbi:unnamed protein product [Phytophthora fragariaefolia]|uniref:Unnamed protein product n=1 Tax=Phytophthora fragariaefolia TaxID=1490495 RepID=A0A9W6YDA6_9STRA|nr:unnamed protein product [Phytophthora fragariaefolia]